MHVTLYHDSPDSLPTAERFRSERVLDALRDTDSLARQHGLPALQGSTSPFVRLGMEHADGHVTKNSLGPFHLAWLAQQHTEWPGLLFAEAQEIRRTLEQQHGSTLRYMIWAGMGGSAEDKAAYQAVGLLKRGPKLYILDSTDPAKLQAILDDMQQRGGQTLPTLLRSTLVVGMALGMTSYEPVLNLEKLAQLYASMGIDSRPNFLYMTLPDSLLDRFGQQQGYRKIELQLDGGNTTSGRHSSPLTKGSLLPLALAGANLPNWFSGTSLSDEQVHACWRLSAFLHGQALQGRDKITLVLPRPWAGLALWTKQNFEESLGKSETFGLKIVINERLKMANYRAPKDPQQDRVFLFVQAKDLPSAEAAKLPLLRRAGYPVAQLTLTEASISRYMQSIHYTVLGMAYLQEMNFVTQPSVELYKQVTAELMTAQQQTGSLDSTPQARQAAAQTQAIRWRDGLTLYAPNDLDATGLTAPQAYAALLARQARERRVEYGELTFFGDTRYNPDGQAVRKCLDRAGERLFRNVLKMPVDVYEGPAMNHSYHEMVIGHGRCFSTILLSEEPVRIAACQYDGTYHRAQFLATQIALRQRGRQVVSLTLPNLSPECLTALEEFFKVAAQSLKRMWRG